MVFFLFSLWRIGWFYTGECAIFYFKINYLYLKYLLCCHVFEMMEVYYFKHEIH